MPDAFDHCEALVREADKDRFLATLFAPGRYRQALFALYAFNVEVARVRDIAREPLPGEIRLQWWRDVLTGTDRDDARANPVAAALIDTVARYRLAPQVLADLVDARRFDVYDDPMGTIEDLEIYATKTSSALIELAAQILSDGRDPKISALARHAGIAYAIAGLLRTFAVHAARRQLYVPLGLLQHYSARAEDAFAGEATVEVRAALAEMRLLARRHLDRAREVLGAVPGAVLPALLPVALVRPALARMERRSYDPFRTGDLPQWRRQWILWRAARRPARLFE